MTKKQEPMGMYGETPKVKIGRYLLSSQGKSSIWIEHESGEGGEFKESSLEALIHAFYEKHF